MKAKDKHKKKLLEYLGNPDNEFLTRQKMYEEVLGITRQTFYSHFTPVEIGVIENEAFEIRKANSAKDRSKIMDSLRAEAVQGNVQAAKEYLDRTEGKVLVKTETKVEATVKHGLTTEVLDKIEGVCSKQED